MRPLVDSSLLWLCGCSRIEAFLRDVAVASGVLLQVVLVVVLGVRVVGQWTTLDGNGFRILLLQLQQRLLAKGLEPYLYTPAELHRIAAFRKDALTSARAMFRSIFQSARSA